MGIKLCGVLLRLDCYCVWKPLKSPSVVQLSSSQNDGFKYHLTVEVSPNVRTPEKMLCSNMGKSRGPEEPLELHGHSDTSVCLLSF